MSIIIERGLNRTVLIVEVLDSESITVVGQNHTNTRVEVIKMDLFFLNLFELSEIKKRTRYIPSLKYHQQSSL